MAGPVRVARSLLSRALLETSVSLERLSMAMVGDMSFYEEGPQHRTFVGLLSTGNATVAESAKVDEMATILGGVTIEDNATVEAMAVVTGPATIGAGAKVAAGAVVKQNVTLEPGSEVGPGAIVLPGTVVPAGELWTGKPAARAKDLSP